jgi:hypothetical protein
LTWLVPEAPIIHGLQGVMAFRESLLDRQSSKPAEGVNFDTQNTKDAPPSW